MPSLCQNSNCFMHFQLSIIVLSNSRFLEMTMPISKTGTPIQIRIGEGSVTFPIIWPMRGQYVFLMTKSIFFVCVCFFFFFFFFSSFNIIFGGKCASFY